MLMVRPGFIKTLAGIAVLVGAGFVSSWASQGACRRLLARRAIEEFQIPKGQSVAIFSLPGEEESFKTLSSLGIEAKRCAFQRREDEEFDCFPWVSVENFEMLGPFVVRSSWASILFPTSGGGTRTTMIAVFGLVVPIAEPGVWIS